MVNIPGMETQTRGRTGILFNPACSSPKAPICAAKSLRLASHRLRRATAAERLNEGSVRAETTYARTVRRRFGSDEVEEGGGCDCVANQEE